MRHGSLLMVATLGSVLVMDGCAIVRKLRAPLPTPPSVARSTEPGAAEAALLEEAGVARDFGDDDVALVLFYDVLAENPMIATAYVGIGDIELERRRFDEAEAAYGRAARIEPDNIRAHFGRGLALQMLDRAIDAMKAYHRVLTLQPDHARANVNLGTIYLQLGEPESAIAFARRAVELEPESGSARANLGAVYEMLGRDEEAIGQYLIALELMEPSPERLMNLVNVLGRARRYQEAANTAVTLVRLAPTANAYERLGLVRFRLNDDDRALEAYEQAVNIDPRHWPSWNGIGVIHLNRWLLSSRRETEAMFESREAFRRSLRVNARQPKVVALMARYGLR